jgi:rSAM/selenodomain-associated transferase 2
VTACSSPIVSVIVPVLDEGRSIVAVLDRLAGLPGRFEVIVVDGGSSDGTPALAAAHRSAPHVARAARGRGEQMNHGAALAGGEILLFLHADTVLPEAAYALLARAWRRGAIGGNFRVAFDGGDRFSAFLTRVARVQRRLGVYYGDSAIFVRADVFRELGGFRPIAVMEDYELIRRIERRGRTECLAGVAVTSARRWRQDGEAATVLRWLAIQALFSLRVPPRLLGRMYPPTR